MLHSNRIWSIAEAESPEQLAYQLTRLIFYRCNGFRLGEYVFVNDATGADSAQEYGVLKPDAGGYVQIESYTFSGSTPERALGFIRAVLAGEYDNECYDRIGADRLESPDLHGLCHYCG